MITIWKYILEVTDKQTIEVPEDGKILSVQVQNGKPCLWVLVNSENKKVVRTIVTYGTGNRITDYKHDYIFIGTYQLHNGGLVFHVFE